MLITGEGLDGAGKTTLISGLARSLGAVVLREPGGVELSERIRELVADPALDVDPPAAALLYPAGPAGGESSAGPAQPYDELAAAAPGGFIVPDAPQPPKTVLASALKALS